MMYKQTLAALCLSSFIAGSATAAVSPEEAARLGNDLTPLGAEAAGNADGSIPPWNPNGSPIPANFVAGSDNYVDAYPDDEVLFTIDVNNYKDYAENLTCLLYTSDAADELT